MTTETAAKPAAKKATASRTAKPDAIDQLTAALAQPADDVERQKVEAFLDSKIAEVIAERGADRPRNIIEALVECMRRVSHVGKESRNEQGRGYNFRGIDAVVNALGPVMREVGVVVGVQVKSYTYGDVEVGKDRTRQAHSQVQVAYSFSYSNAEGHISTHTSTVPGEAMDSGDKATAKSMSVAMRIALLQTFALPTDEPDPDSYTFERSAAPRKTPNDVYAGVSWARNMDDLDLAHAHIKDTIGAELFSITVVNKAGEEMRADRYVEAAIASMREDRARAVAQQQDSAAEAPQAPAEAAPAQEETRAPEAEQPSPTESARRHATGCACAECRARRSDDMVREHQEAVARTNAAEPAPTGESKHLAMVRNELAYQAQVLAVPFGEYTADLLDAEGGVDFGKAQKRAGEKRVEVITRLREQGAADTAARYEGLLNHPLLEIAQVIDGENFRRETVQPRETAGN